MNFPKKTFKGDFAKSRGGPSELSHSHQMVLMMTRQETAPRERHPKMLEGEFENSSKNPRDLTKTGIVTA